MKRAGISALLLLLAALLWWQQGADGQLYEITGSSMGTSFSIKLVTAEADRLDELTNQVSALLYRLDRELMSTYAEDSELSSFNRSPVGAVFPVSPELIEVARLAAEVSEASDGAFDVTIGPLVNRWGFGPGSAENDALGIPSLAEIEALRQQVGYRSLQIHTDPPALSKDKPLYVDFSGIAKGYAVDKVAEFLEAEGILNYFVEVGGELRIRGYKPGQQAWVPAIERPEDSAPQVHALMNSRGEPLALAGSGDYRNYFEQEGVRYSHEIDPRTGRPITHRLAAVYVIADTAARADALATAFMVMGHEQSAELAEALGAGAYFITRSAEGNGFDSHVNQLFSNYLQNPE